MKNYLNAIDKTCSYWDRNTNIMYDSCCRIVNPNLVVSTKAGKFKCSTFRICNEQHGCKIKCTPGRCPN